MVASNPDLDPFRQMYRSLDRRYRPEDVAQLILVEMGDRLAPEVRSVVQHAARGALQHGHGYSSMSQDFHRPIGMGNQLAVARELFTSEPPADDGDPLQVEPFIHACSVEIKKTAGSNSFKEDRLNRESREIAGLDLPKRQYNKRFRLLARMERKRERLLRELKKRSFTLISKSRLAASLTWDEFASDPNSACFIAYFVARCNLRSEFTISGQQRPYDKIADALFQNCRVAANANWWAIAHVFPDREVLGHLADGEKGRLLGRWFSTLQGVADFLRELWSANDFNRQTMIVRRGNDSTTWNNTAGAWNKARESWIAFLHAMEMDELLDEMCPGKVLRLMAADVAAWHRSAGGGLDPDTLVWMKLPLPWEVFSDGAPCSRPFVEEVCRQYNVDPIKNGWSAPRPTRAIAEYRPTPELVHGVTVSNPFLATWLKERGVFSGKKMKVPMK